MPWLQLCCFQTWPGSHHGQSRQLSKAAEPWGQQNGLGPAACFCYVRALGKASKLDADRQMLLGLVKDPFPAAPLSVSCSVSLIFLANAAGPTLQGQPHLAPFLLPFQVSGSPSLLLLTSLQQQQPISSEYSTNVPLLQEVLNGLSGELYK